MVCSDHKWTPQDLALYEEQQKSKKASTEKGKRRVRRYNGNSSTFRALLFLVAVVAVVGLLLAVLSA